MDTKDERSADDLEGRISDLGSASQAVHWMSGLNSLRSDSRQEKADPLLTVGDDDGSDVELLIDLADELLPEDRIHANVISRSDSLDESTSGEGDAGIAMMLGGLPPPPWMLSIGRDFRKDLDAVDRKMQGRILSAIADLCEEEICARGDTLKPLKGKYERFWRLRLGDFRLIFLPERERECITLISFGARGAVYED